MLSVLLYRRANGVLSEEKDIKKMTKTSYAGTMCFHSINKHQVVLDPFLFNSFIYIIFLFSDFLFSFVSVWFYEIFVISTFGDLRRLVLAFIKEGKKDNKCLNARNLEVFCPEMKNSH